MIAKNPLSFYIVDFAIVHYAWMPVESRVFAIFLDKYC